MVLTKSDLADAGMIDVVRLEIQELVSGSFLDDAPVVVVSARTGQGIPELRRTLAGSRLHGATPYVRRAAAVAYRPRLLDEGIWHGGDGDAAHGASGARR